MSASPNTPVMAFLRARGCTLTWNVAPAGVSWTGIKAWRAPRRWGPGSNRAKFYGSVLCAMSTPGISGSNEEVPVGRICARQRGETRARSLSKWGRTREAAIRPKLIGRPASESAAMSVLRWPWQVVVESMPRPIRRFCLSRKSRKFMEVTLGPALTVPSSGKYPLHNHGERRVFAAHQRQ